MSALDGLDKDVIDTLSPEERAAIADADEAEIAALRNVAQADGGDAAADDDDDDDDSAADAGDAAAAAADTGQAAAPAPAAAAPAPAPAPAPADAAAAPSAEGEDADEPQLAAPYDYKLPDDYQDRVKAHKEAIADLRARRDSGDLSIEDYDTELEKLNDQGDELRSMRIRADMAADQRKEYEQRQINAAWVRTLKTAKADGIDYATDAAKHADFDTFIKALANRPENNDKPLSWFFAEAHKRVLVMHGMAPAASGGKAGAADTPAPAADPKKDSAAARAPDLSALPKDLAGVPGGQSTSDVSGDEFEDLDSLEGLELEDAIARNAARDPNFANKYVARVRGNSSARH